jgi:ABC-type nitrate/sulfonate/bicarbonate transport system substrate-binding protein
MTAQTSPPPVHAFGLPERPKLRIGFVPLTDCAPLVAAKIMDFGRRNGLELELSRQPSWAAIRDKLLSGELDAAQSLYGLVYGVQLGLGGPQADMAILMTLNRNGQAITVSNQLSDSLQSGVSLQAAISQLGRKPVFAQTFPTGTHAMWLNYWLAAHGVHPLRDIESIVIPPPQMADALAHGELDGFCAGEPWHAVAVRNKAGRTITCSSEIWMDHPEKALSCRREFASLYPNTVRALVRTILEACRWLENPTNKITMGAWLARPEYIDIPSGMITPRLLGDYGGAMLAGTPSPVRFFDERGLNRPLVSDGLWFLTQFRRWGLLKSTDNWEKLVTDVCQSANYAQAAQDLDISSDILATKPAKFIDGVEWTDAEAIQYSEAFAIKSIP